ncbi:hypothetical protein SK128_012959 [Halocaridina rubra]|uniref:Uncharacterized protein n=1 Tax=Halocaridina rubra TaxID=373956 RepID=A0AAN8XGL5_HALRR
MAKCVPPTTSVCPPLCLTDGDTDTTSTAVTTSTGDAMTTPTVPPTTAVSAPMDPSSTTTSATETPTGTDALAPTDTPTTTTTTTWKDTPIPTTTITLDTTTINTPRTTTGISDTRESPNITGTCTDALGDGGTSDEPLLESLDWLLDVPNTFIKLISEEPQETPCICSKFVTREGKDGKSEIECTLIPLGRFHTKVARRTWHMGPVTPVVRKLSRRHTLASMGEPR